MKGILFRCSLQLNIVASIGGDHVQVNVSTAVLFVGKVENGLAVNDTDRDGGYVAHQVRLKLLGAHSKCEGDPAASDACAAGASIGNEHIAVNENGALAKLGEVNGLAQRATDQALNLMGAATELAADRLTIGAGVGGAGEHAVFGGHPTGPLTAKVWRHALLD